MRVEEAGGGILKVTPTGIDLPSFGFWRGSAILFNSNELNGTHHSFARA